jgi:O-methyltransferase
MTSLRMPHFRRFFQLQIPQVFRPTVSSVLANTVGHVNLEGPAATLSVLAYWVRFSRWCRLHPIPLDANGSIVGNKEGLYESVIQNESLDLKRILYLEFGVYRGASLKWWLTRVSNAEARFVGFDTFTGLPEHWRATEPVGAFNANGNLPDIADSRCSFEVGLFQETLGRFIKRSDLSGQVVVNLDADMYTSTLFVLTSLAPHLKSGDLIFFDEFSCPLDEYRAFEDYVRAFRVSYKVIGAVRGYTRICVKLIDVPAQESATGAASAAQAASLLLIGS